VVDVEGNGHQPPELVELAVVPITGGEIGKPLACLVKPDHPIRPFATKIHGIGNRDVAACPALTDISAEVLTALDADALVAHTAYVDLAVLRRGLRGWKDTSVIYFGRVAVARLPTATPARHNIAGQRLSTTPGRARSGNRRLFPDTSKAPEVFDTLKIARQLLPGLPNYQLSTLVERFELAEGLSGDLRPHRATYDALVTARLFVLLAGRAGSLEVLRGTPPEGGDDASVLF
jgi:DNA polymerase III epsilon subunit-like protein